MGFALLAIAGVLAAAEAQSTDHYQNGDGTRWKSKLDANYAVTVNIFVRDIEEATKWYLALFDDVPMLRPTPTVTAFEIVKGFWLELMESDRINSGGFAVRFGVKDIQAEQSRLQSLGVDTGEILRPARVALIEFPDPDGNLLSFYELELDRLDPVDSDPANGQDPAIRNAPQSGAASDRASHRGSSRDALTRAVYSLEN